MSKQPKLIRLADRQEFELGQETTIGRRDDCQIMLDESGASRLHAQIMFENNALSIEDFSRYGTILNGTPVEGIANLLHEDIICFDQDEYQVSFPDSTSKDSKNISRSPALTEIANDAQRKPLPDRPLDEGTRVVSAQPSERYDPLDYRQFLSPSLVVRNGHLSGEVFSLADNMQRWTLGSSDNNDIRIKDDGVSSNHAVIHRTGNRWEVIDQMSTNVLRVNGRVTNKCYLAKGDKINLGPVDCEFVLPDGYRVREKKTRSGFFSFVKWGLALLVLCFIILLAFYYFKTNT